MLRFSGSIRRQSYGKFPSVSINTSGVIVEVYQPFILSHEIYYKVGMLNGDEISVSEDETYLDKGRYPKVAINNENRVVEVHEGRIRRCIYYRIGTIDVHNRIIEWHHHSKLCSGRFPSVAVHKDRVVITYDQAYGSYASYCCVGNFNADGTDIKWEESDNRKNDKLFDVYGITETSVAINDQNVVVAGRGWSNILCRVGQFRENAIEFREIIPFGYLGYCPTVCLDDDGYIIMVWQSFTLRRLNYATGNIPNPEQPSITWLRHSPLRSYSHGYNPTIAISPAGGHVLEEHETNYTPYRCRLYYQTGALMKSWHQEEAPQEEAPQEEPTNTFLYPQLQEEPQPGSHQKQQAFELKPTSQSDQIEWKEQLEEEHAFFQPLEKAQLQSIEGKDFEEEYKAQKEPQSIKEQDSEDKYAILFEAQEEPQHPNQVQVLEQELPLVQQDLEAHNMLLVEPQEETQPQPHKKVFEKLFSERRSESLLKSPKESSHLIQEEPQPHQEQVNDKECAIHQLPGGDSGENDVHQSAYFSEAKSRANIPFLAHKLLECTTDGLEYTDDTHDITFRVPKGAVTAGQKIHFEVAVAMYGPFKFPENTQPISPIVWLCLLEEEIELLKPFHVIIPHYLTGNAEKRYQDHQVCFVKASHKNHKFENDQINYIFDQCDTEPQFASYGSKSYGVLVSKHCCFYCLQANHTQKLDMDSEYILSRIEHNCPGSQTNEIYFLVTYFLSLCLKSVSEQFPSEDGYQSHYVSFKFQAHDHDEESYLQLTVPTQCHEYVKGKEPSDLKIKSSSINFWKESCETMMLKHKLKMYPPRMKLTICWTKPDSFSIPLQFAGCSPDSQLDVDLKFPIDFPSSPTEKSAGSHIMSPQSQNIKCGKPKLSAVFKELLPLAAQWKTIGGVLGIGDDNSGKIEKIDNDEQSVQDKLRAMLSEWLKTPSQKTTWDSLVEAVESIDSGTAQKIRDSLVNI